MSTNSPSSPYAASYPMDIPAHSHDRQNKEREYSESLAAYSLRGFMAARDRYFEHERRRQSPPGLSSSPDSPEQVPQPLARSTIRSPADTHAQHASGDTGSTKSHPRRAGRNGTPLPNDVERLAPMPAISDESPAGAAPRKRPAHGPSRSSDSGGSETDAEEDAQNAPRAPSSGRAVAASKLLGMSHL